LLKPIAPTVTRLAVVRDAAITAGIGLWGAIQSVSPSFGVEPRPIDMRDFGGSPNGGLILTGSALAVTHRDLIISLAARYVLPAIYMSATW
jgi:putative tryptophan/tyrosine transport system substrate-binding protein